MTEDEKKIIKDYLDKTGLNSAIAAHCYYCPRMEGIAGSWIEKTRACPYIGCVYHAFRPHQANIQPAPDPGDDQSQEEDQ
jgi:hypothetical protein